MQYTSMFALEKEGKKHNKNKFPFYSFVPEILQ
jgi:hypothetical protein